MNISAISFRIIGLLSFLLLIVDENERDSYLDRQFEQYSRLRSNRSCVRALRTAACPKLGRDTSPVRHRPHRKSQLRRYSSCVRLPLSFLRRQVWQVYEMEAVHLAGHSMSIYRVFSFVSSESVSVSV